MTPLNGRGAYLTHQLEDGRWIDVVPLLFGRARILLSDNLTTWCTLDEW
jgi:hypothetical protein